MPCNQATQTLSIPKENLFIPHRCGATGVVYKGREFYVIEGEKETPIDRANLPLGLRGIEPSQLQKAFKAGYLALTAVGESFGLRYKTRLRGGGPFSGAVGYTATKIFCYGVAAAAAGKVVENTTGGAPGAIAGALVAAVTGRVPAGAGVVAAAINGARQTDTAADVTIGTIAACGGVVGAVTGVETAATTVGALLTAAPFLP